MNRDNINKGLERDARQVVERLPENFTREEYENVVKKVNEFLARNDYTRADVARWIGYSRSVVAEFLKGKYKGNIERLANKLINVINSISRKKVRTQNKPFIDTTIAKRIGTIITQTEAFCDDEGKIGVVIGDAGHGKSYCLRQYAEANKNAVYVELDQTMSSTAIFSQIARALKLDDSGTLAAIAGRLINLLRERYLILIIDEASALRVKSLDQLRQIIVVKGKCPLILAGNSDLLKTIMQPSTRRGCESLDQFTSRLMAVLNLDEIASNKDGGLYTVEDVRKLYEYGGIRLTDGAVNKIRHICMTPKCGRLRTCTHIIAALHTSGIVYESGLITSDLITAAIEQLNLPIKDRMPVAIVSEEYEETFENVAATG